VEAELKTPQPMWMVRRDIFDHFLIQQAQKQGLNFDNTEEGNFLSTIGR